MRRRGSAAAVLVGALLAASAAHAVDLETLVMPGPVIAGHADVEADCGRCHQPFDASAQGPLCLDCHEPVAEDLRTRRGFHGRVPSTRSSECRDCHGEHRGREADITGLDRETFDHDQTDHPLEGAHRRLACGDCHSGKDAFRDAPDTCIGCHRSDDVHRGKLGSECADCHDAGAWKQARFDHDATDFPLVGKHQKVDCALCHPSQRFDQTTTDCRGCHARDDVHRGDFGSDCKTCHDPRGWKRTTFDHARDTRFRLTGAHARTACKACHTGRLHEQKLETTCFACHRLDDEHRGGNGDRCDRCHTDVAWSPVTFEHDRNTEFPLRGAHRDARCSDCHRKNPYQEKLETRCAACHAGDDVHRGQQGERCEQCHRESGWGDDVVFDHDLTSFPLLGLHAVASCEQCHTSPRFKDADGTCRACHARDDFHEGRLSNACERCHTPNAWRVWRFDHDASTSFPLRGGHEGLDCHACHRARVRDEIRLSQSCGSCHARDDAHRGGFGRDCGRCHVETSWSETRVGP